MSLQNKFLLLLAIFGVSIVANVLVSVWCIQVYGGDAINRFRQHMSAAERTHVIENLLADLVRDLENFQGSGDSAYAHELRERAENMRWRVVEMARLHAGVAPQSDVEAVTVLSRCVEDRIRQYLDVVDSLSAAEAGELSNGVVAECIQPLQRHLAVFARADDTAITRTTMEFAATQNTVTMILGANALAAFLLATVGILLVRRWVLRPVEVLSVATAEHARGNLAHRITGAPRDELGALAESMNQMADSLQEIQKQLVQQERLAALGAVASMLAHNIRNPLAGIRASAQSAMAQPGGAGPAESRLGQIVETVDSLNRWLKQLLLVNRPLDLDRRPTRVGEIVAPVLAAQQSNARRRGVSLVYREENGACRVHVDARYVEQAVQVLVDNALDASPASAEVTIEAEPVGPSGRWVDLRVCDRGAGIPESVREQITAPYFTTKPGGTGIGLHLARKAVESHGGAILFESPPSGGTVVTLRLPTRDFVGATHGADSSR